MSDTDRVLSFLVDLRDQGEPFYPAPDKLVVDLLKAGVVDDETVAKRVIDQLWQEGRIEALTVDGMGPFLRAANTLGGAGA